MWNLSSCLVYALSDLALYSHPSQFSIVRLRVCIPNLHKNCFKVSSLKSLFFSCWVTLTSRHLDKNFAFLSLPQLLIWHLQRTISVESAWTQPSTVSCWSAATWWPVPPVVNRWTSAPSVDSMLYDVCIYSGRNDIALNYGSFFSYGISLDGSRNWPFFSIFLGY